MSLDVDVWSGVGVMLIICSVSIVISFVSSPGNRSVTSMVPCSSTSSKVWDVDARGGETGDDGDDGEVEG